jgi:hypothetical protein
MVRAGGVGVHAGAAFDWIQAGEDFDVGGVVATAHAYVSGGERRPRIAGAGGHGQAG